jgi:hypothetical protein
VAKPTKTSNEGSAVPFSQADKADRDTPSSAANTCCDSLRLRRNNAKLAAK